ncbi:hypothetical protein [Cryptosporangium phraense]|uniref:CU044_5270 family protein n=1 Tax=Cryptosporangium phraense TaxID=2593070 RepID=A0A545AMY2_9ACTN|nr:hypothetical protein [Cryptosporangium phraense]TQS42697.1 hypothetical protein FL583_23730 [Cryptosporangium phraense]
MIDCPLPDADQRRAALLAEITRTEPVARRRRFLVPALAAGAVAATVAIAALAGAGLRSDPPAPVADAKPIQDLRARLDVVDRTVKPRELGFNPSDFVYVQTRTTPGTDPAGTTEIWVNEGGGSRGAILDAKGLRTTDPLLTQWKAGAPQNVVSAVKYPTYTYMSGAQGLRGNGDEALYAELRRTASGNDAIFAKVRLMLRNGGLASPAVRTWLYRAALRVPGVTVRTGVSDAVGRPGTALTLGRQVILIDPDDGSLLAESDGASGGPPGPAIVSTALVPYAGVPPAK